MHVSVLGFANRVSMLVSCNCPCSLLVISSGLAGFMGVLRNNTNNSGFCPQNWCQRGVTPVSTYKVPGPHATHLFCTGLSIRFPIYLFNPILTGGGGGGQFDPPVRNPWLPRDRRRSRQRLFMSFFFQVLRIFWYQVCENRTISREVTWRFVLARRHKICPKSAFCICLCTKHMEITDFLKML